ncbi:unnamed protein product [Mytilus coruscus]|uniref:HSPA12B n=1 Tax=Mytilus coruscus TaxID=42192 RepID=A0A6J8DHX8_MYTCO|nr:unnamed protein product [Mytilus coruscus]
MNLHNNKNITRGMMLEDITGTKRLPAFDVFKLSIQYLVNHLLETLKTRGNVVRHNEVQWVLTVPAIWTDRAKKFMRSCAEAAGIPSNNLILALEPETASIFCQYLSTGCSDSAIGGGTADITVHRKAANGKLKEKHRAMGNNCGGTSIDKRFLELFEEIIGETTMNSLKKESPLAYLDLVIKEVKHVLMVGGFSECQLMQSAVRKAFPDQRIIIPDEAGLSVLKGAVLFGHKPDYIQSRVMRCSYGVKTNVAWNEKKYDRKHYVVMEGEERCDNIFSLIVGKDESVEAGMIVKKSFFTPYKHQDKMDIMVYVSEETTPGYVDDDRCFLLCTPTITFSETCEERRWVDVEFVLGNTEIDLKAHDKNSGEAISAKFNLI